MTGRFHLPEDPLADNVWVRCLECDVEGDIKDFEEAAQEANA